jgi:hypothetical protein
MRLWPDAAPALSIKTAPTASRLAKAGKLPVPVIRVGGSWVVRTADLRKLLGMDEPAAS